MAAKKINSYCRYCERDTKHDVLSEKTVSERDEYRCDIEYQIVQCCGCETIGFRKVFYDIESTYPVSDEEWEVPQDISIFPRSIQGHRALEHTYYLPKIVRKIYEEVLLALQEDARILAGLGLRGTVEAVCNDLQVLGKNLDIRISKLATAGHISKTDAERLHAIRFMGNDAAHEIKSPPKNSLSVALRIVEHLLASVYILSEEADGALETTISDYARFEILLNSHIDELGLGEELPLPAILGRDLRRVHESITDLEKELNRLIVNGTYNRLSIGKMSKYNNSNNELQHYIVQSS